MLAKGGFRVVQAIGVPDGLDLSDDVEAVVVALKSRTNSATEAVEMSLQSLSWLQGQGARQIFFIYCSTFDSHPMGISAP